MRTCSSKTPIAGKRVNRTRYANKKRNRITVYMVQYAIAPVRFDRNTLLKRYVNCEGTDFSFRVSPLRGAVLGNHEEFFEYSWSFGKLGTRAFQIFKNFRKTLRGCRERSHRKFQVQAFQVQKFQVRAELETGFQVGFQVPPRNWFKRYTVPKKFFVLRVVSTCAW